MNVVQTLRTFDFPQSPCPTLADGTPLVRLAADEIENLRAVLIDTESVLNQWARQPPVADFGAVKIPQRQIERVADKIRAILHPES